MHGRSEISINNQIAYQYYYSCVLPEELPDEISISTFSSAREVTDTDRLYDNLQNNGFSYEDTSLSESTKMVRNAEGFE